MNYTVKVALAPELDLPKFNSILGFMKTSLGKFGEDISPIDAAKFEAEMNKFGIAVKSGFDEFEKGAKDSKDEVDDLGDKLDETKERAGGLGKAFNFNQTVDAIRNVSDSLGVFTEGFVGIDTATAQIDTLGGAAKENSDAFRDMSIEMSKDIPIQAEALQTATYDALSAGINATKEDITAFMTASAKLAVGGGEQIGNTVNLLSSLINAYGESAAATGKYSDALFTTVNLGKTTLPELQSSMANIIPTAAAYGVNIENVGAALALMTANGIPTVQTTTKLNQLMIEMQKPGAELTKVLNAAGISAESLGQKVQSGDFIGALKDMDGAFKQAGISATQAFSSTESGAAFNVLSKDFDKLGSTLDAFANSSGSTEAAFQSMSGTVANQTNQMKAYIGALLIQFNDFFGKGFAVAVGAAQQLAPILTSVVALHSATEFLTLAKIKDAAISAYTAVTSKALAAAQLIQLGATNAVTVAQNALNISMLANPVGLIIIGVVALVGALYLLYKNVEPVRVAFDATFSAISDAVEYVGKAISTFIDNLVVGFKSYFALFESLIGSAVDVVTNLLEFNFSGAFDALTGAAGKAANAVGDEIEKGLTQRSWKAAAENLSKGLGESAEIKVKINSQESLNNFVAEYENAKQKIEALNAKKSTKGITADEQKELDSLQKQAQKTAAEIAKIAPETKKNMALAVDAAGNLVEQFDINVKKAKDLANSDTSSQKLAAAANDYSSALIKQSGIIDDQKKGLTELKKEIDKTNDPTQKDRLIKKYNEELAAVNENKKALIQSFLEGGKAGLLTENAIDKISKQIGISSAEAKKMVLAEVLKDASKSGKLTEEQISKLAKQYGVSDSEAKKILETQKKITTETGNTNDAAKSWSQTLEGVSANQKAGKEQILKAQLDLNKGVIDEAKYQKEVSEGQQKIKDGNTEAKELQDAYNKAKRNGLLIGFQEYSEAVKTTKEQKTQYEIQKAIFDSKNAEQGLIAKELQASQESERLKNGIFLNENQQRNENLKLLKNTSFEAKRQLDDYSAVYEAAKKQFEIEEKRGKVSEKTSANFKESSKQLRELTIASLSAGNVEIAANLKLELDNTAVNKEVEKLSKESSLAGLEFKVKLGLESESTLLKAQLEKISSDISSLTKDLNIEMNLGGDGDALKVQQLKDSIAGLNRDYYELNQKLEAVSTDEKLNSIEDLAVREREISLRESQKTLAEDLKLAGTNNALKAQAHLKHSLRKYEIDEEYLAKSSKLQDIALVSSRKFATAFAEAMIQNTINPVDEAIANLQKKIDSAKAPEAEDSKLKDEENALIESYKKRELSTKEFQDKLQSINKKRLENDQKNENASSITMLETQRAMSAGLAAVQKDFNIRAAEELKKLHEGTVTDTNAFIQASLGSAMAGFGALLAAGEDVGTAFRKGLLVNMIQTAEQVILTYIPQIYAAFFSWMGPWGLAAATGAIGLVYAGLGAAKAELGRKTGEVNINGAGTPTSDDNLRFLSKSESVLTAKATMAEYSIPLYEWQNKTGGSPIEYFTTVNPAPMTSLIERIIDRESFAKSDKIIIESVRESRSDSRELAKLQSQMDVLIEEVRAGNFKRKQHITSDINFRFENDEIARLVKLDKEKTMRNS